MFLASITAAAVSIMVPRRRSARPTPLLHWTIGSPSSCAWGQDTPAPATVRKAAWAFACHGSLFLHHPSPSFSYSSKIRNLPGWFDRSLRETLWCMPRRDRVQNLPHIAICPYPLPQPRHQEQFTISACIRAAQSISRKKKIQESAAQHPVGPLLAFS
jgi:hypothetical protein